jgi:nitric oxide reductase NorD protein
MRRALQAHSMTRSPLHSRARQGSRMDLKALVAWAVDERCSRSGDDRTHRPGGGDDRIYRIRSVTRPRTSWSVLIDASASTSAQGPFSGLDLSTSAAAMTATVLSALRTGRDEITVQSFCSNGRHAVFVECLKSFDASLDVAALSQLRSGLSTRLGAALRHATAGLAQRPSQRRILLLLSDGEPHDVDVHDPRYLLEDARRAVREARQQGVRIVCVQVASKPPRGADAVCARGDSVHLNRLETLPRAIRQLNL